MEKEKSVPENARGKERRELIRARLIRSLSAAVLARRRGKEGGQEKDDDDDVERESTMRHRCIEHLDSSHSVAPVQTSGGTTPPKLRRAPFRPGRRDFPPSRGSGQLFTSEQPSVAAPSAA